MTAGKRRADLTKRSKCLGSKLCDGNAVHPGRSLAKFEKKSPNSRRIHASRNRAYPLDARASSLGRSGSLLHASPLGRLQLQQLGVGILRTQWLGLGEQCLDVAIAGTVVEDLVVQEGRQRNEIPAAKPNVAALPTLPAAHEAFAFEDEEDLFGFMALDRDAIPRRHRLYRHRESRRRDGAAQILGICRAAGSEVAALGTGVARVAGGLEPEHRPVFSAVGKPCDTANQFLLQR